MGRTSSDLLKTWDELKRVFIRRFCPPSLLDSRGLTTGLTAAEALESIKEIVEHSHRWHKEESDKKMSINSLSTITDKLQNLNHDMNNLRENIHKINLKSNMEFRHEEVKSLGNPRPVNMVIEMADRSMQSPKGIVENVLVKIHKFVFPIDFVILDIVKDNKVPIILRRPMLATAHARIDVFGGKISLEVGKEQVIFKANKGATPVTISLVCAIKDFDVIDNIKGPDDLEEFLMDDDLNGDLGNFLQDNNIFLNYENPGDNPPSPNKSPSRNWNPVEEFQDSDDNLGIRIDNFVAIDDL
ncbi:putative reverse transcriptase domain-containing protein [Tanacetum coccineum]|uniref:Reverse transcriptase domain-containing protein n=1 Tax=Tanacetum coccineum TaxID=301880 RepID=A0ABQ5IK27_9ASTR